MTSRRSLETMEKDARAADLFRRGLTYRQISAELGFKTPSAAFTAVRRAARDAARDPFADAEAKQIMLDRLQDYRRLAWRIATTKHYITTQSGKVATGTDGKTALVDDAPVLHALDRLLRFDDHEAKLCGLYAPAKSRVEVITEDALDAEMAEIARKIALNDAREARPADTGAA